MPFPLLFHRFYLRSIGYRIVSSGYRAKGGEVDVIGWEGDVLVFVEVKARQNADPPEDAVGFRKQQRVIRAAQAYISKHRLHDVPYRFDVLAVTVPPGSQPEFRLLRDAFNMYN